MGTPLEGITVLDLTNAMQGPYATTLLADLGAEVIKLEDVPSGDFVRGVVMGKTEGILPPCSFNYLFETLNRGKKSVAVNLRKPEAREIVYRLAQRSDVFVSNLREQALNAWGLDYESMKRFNPKIIYAVGAGFGLQGPDKDLVAFDMAAQARSGLLSVVGETDEPPPPWGVPWLADTSGGMLLAFSIVLALLVRERTGLGQRVGTSLLGAQIALGSPLLNAFLASGEEPRRQKRTKPYNPLRNNYQTRDGKWLCLNMTLGDRYWPGLCQALGLQHLVDSPKFNSNAARSENNEELVSILDHAFAQKGKDEWMRILPAHGLVAAPIQTYSEVAADPQVLANDYIVEIDHPTLGRLRETGCFIHLSQTPPRVRPAAPEYSQHTEEVLLQIGYTWEEIGRLKDKQVII